MSEQPMTCDRFDAMLHEYVDGSLDHDARAAFEAHAAACSACGPLLADLSALTRDAHAMPDLVNSTALWPAIAARHETPVVELGAHPGAAPVRDPLRSR